MKMPASMIKAEMSWISQLTATGQRPNISGKHMTGSSERATATILGHHVL